jgi:hypothetical protein
MKQSEVQKELEKFRNYVIAEARKNLSNDKKNVSKTLYNSLKGNVKAMPNSLSMDFEMDIYGQFQDKGVKGANPSLVKNGKQKAPNSPFSFKNKMPPMEPLSKWAQKKNIRFRNADGTYAKGGYKTLGFWLQKRIYAQGIKPSLFFTKPFEAAFKRLPDQLIEKFGLDMVDLFKTTQFKNEKK